MATIKFPFGNDLNSNFYGGIDSLGTMTANEPKKVATIDSMFSYIRSATATNGKKLALTIDSALPAGAILVVYHDASPTGSELTFSTGFATSAKEGWRRLGATTAADGTGNYIATFIYNGSQFMPISVLNTSKPALLIR
jgi:hypothetical protein